MTEIERLISPDAAALDAARRLKAALPSRFHIVMGSDITPLKRNSKRAVVIAGTRYPSLRRAAAAYRVAGSIMAGWLASGKAAYAED